MAHEMGGRQRWLWVLSGLTAVVAAQGCGLGWIWVLAGVGLTAGFFFALERILPEEGLAAVLRNWGKAPVIFMILWLVILMGWAARFADDAFPMVGETPVLGWVILALAAWASRKGSGACGACAGVLSLFLLVLYGMVVLFAIPDVSLPHLAPSLSWEDGVQALCLGLLTGAVWLLPCKRGKGRTWPLAVLMPVLAGGLALITAGVLSGPLAKTLPTPLYMLTQSISLFGVLERVESLLSAAMVMGSFCLLSAMACGIQHLGDKILPWKWNGTAGCLLAAVLSGLKIPISSTVLAAGSLVFWILLPGISLLRKKGTIISGKR